MRKITHEITMSQQNPSFDFVERPMKLLLISYFTRFAGINLEETCRKNNISPGEVPVEYVIHGDIALEQNSIPAEMLLHSSIWKIPAKTAEINITMPEKKILIYLDVVDIDHYVLKDMDAIFGKNAKEIKVHMSIIIGMCIPVFAFLKDNNKDLMNNVTTMVDPSTLTIKIVDKTFPRIFHGKRLGFQIIETKHIEETAG
jgi:hypothetical protein